MFQKISVAETKTWTGQNTISLALNPQNWRSSSSIFGQLYFKSSGKEGRKHLHLLLDFKAACHIGLDVYENQSYTMCICHIRLTEYCTSLTKWAMLMVHWWCAVRNLDQLVHLVIQLGSYKCSGIVPGTGVNVGAYKDEPCPHAYLIGWLAQSAAFH